MATRERAAPERKGPDMDERRRLNYGDRKVIEERPDSGWKLADIADELECDPYASWQKPHIENAHTLLRRVLPKGSSFDGLTQDDVNLVCSHINSYPREELGWRSPFETLPAWGQENLPLAFGMRIIPRDEVNLTPSLIGR